MVFLDSEVEYLFCRFFDTVEWKLENSSIRESKQQQICFQKYVKSTIWNSNPYETKLYR